MTYRNVSLQVFTGPSVKVWLHWVTWRNKHKICWAAMLVHADSLNGGPPGQNIAWQFNFLKKHYTWHCSNWWIICFSCDLWSSVSETLPRKLKHNYTLLALLTNGNFSWRDNVDYFMSTSNLWMQVRSMTNSIWVTIKQHHCFSITARNLKKVMNKFQVIWKKWTFS